MKEKNAWAKKEYIYNLNFSVSPHFDIFTTITCLQ